MDLNKKLAEVSELFCIQGTYLGYETICVGNVNKTYEVKIGKKTKRFFSKNSFLKAVPKPQRPDMEAYLEQHEVDFGNVQQVLELYKQLIELTTK